VGAPPRGATLERERSTYGRVNPTCAGSRLPSSTIRSNFLERRQREVRRTRLLGTWANLFRRCRTRRNPGTSVRRSMPEESPTPPAVPCNHL
jgi:hypothetical protein